MILALSAIKIAASAVAVTLASGCARNMLNTRHVTNLPSGNHNVDLLLPKSARTSQQALVAHVQTLSREELLKIFCASEPPVGVEALAGEWDGILLNNNNLGMTAVGSKFMSNVLFGKGNPWNGKSFGGNGKGINRFTEKQSGSTLSNHEFDYSLQESELHKDKRVIKLRYANHQSPVSLWRTMTDEIRCLDENTFIGFGAMAWSGGMLNSAPFLLLRPIDTKSSR